MRVVAGFLLVALAALAACDGGPTRLSHDEFTRRASQVCTFANRRVGTSAGSVRQPDATATRLAHVVGVERATLTRLRRLMGPARDTGGVDRWLAVQSQLVAELDAARQALVVGHDDEAALAVRHATILAARSRALADAVGIRPCRTPVPSLT